ncbi:MAG: hypothetical protein KatS3mg002_0968 [Candidatus Woesearchaeota archaeon]|nr:MAG: hypothetical protein KatS3mg002_0968 [Candidatus Woesearchaeota archaeon]
MTSDNKFYYFKDNVLYYHEKENDKKSFDIKILTFDNDGYPVEHHLDVDDTKLSDRQRAFIKLAKNGNLLKRFEDYKKDSEELKQKIEQYSEAKKEYRIYMLKQKAMVFVNIFMNQLGLRKFLTADYWVDKFGPAEYITKVANAVDPEIWKNNLCNPDNGPLLIGSEQPEGTVYSCV